MKNIPYLMLCLAAVIFFSACSSDRETPVAIGNEQQILHVGNGDEPSDIDPHITTGVPEFHIQQAVFEGLVSKDPKNLAIVPGVAERWEVSEDGRLYTFYLHPEAKWSNGDDLVAEDFVWSWQRALKPALGNQYAYSLFLIKNAEAFYTGDITDFSEVGVKALDKHLLQVELNSPTPYFLQLLDHHSLYPVHRPTIEKFGSIDARGTPWTRPENFVGNGPFTLKDWVPNQIISVKKNPEYWDAESIKLNEIHFHPVQQSSTEERMFRAGQLHILRQLPTGKIDVYRKEHPEVLRTFLNFATYFYRFNTTKPPLNDVRVRQALAYSIDRHQITEHVTKGGQIPAYALTPPSEFYTPSAKMPYDPEKAKALLAEAGYPNGEGFPKLTILYNTMDEHQKIALVIQQMWKQALNIDVTLENQDWKVFLASQRSMNYEISRASWLGDYYDPNTFLDLMITDGGNNETGWSNARYDELIQLAANASDPTERNRYFDEAENLLVDEVPILPIYTYSWNMAVATSVKEWHNNVMDYWSYKNVYLTSETK